MDQIAGICSVTRNFNLAEQYYLRALKLKEKANDPKKVLYAQGLSNLGKICYFQRKFAECEEYARKFISVISENFGANHPDVACGWQNLASIYYVQKKYQLAKGAYTAGIKICDQSLGDRHPTTVQLTRNYASLLQKMDELEQAGIIDASASGVITGSWRTLPLDHNDTLGTGLFDTGEEKMPVPDKPRA
jgi:tetratricopeptide (TPR) repeat protein